MSSNIGDKASNPSQGPSVLHAPWRDVYMQQLSSSLREAGEDPPGTFFARYWAQPEADEQHHVIGRAGSGACAGMIVLNKFPYANGHLLVALAEARASLMEYTEAQRTALWQLVETATGLMEHVLEPQGLNIGINQGSAAGAGVPGHLHVHVVPRWNGDVNFLSVVGHIRVIPCALDQMWCRYRERWDELATG